MLLHADMTVYFPPSSPCLCPSLLLPPSLNDPFECLTFISWHVSVTKRCEKSS